MISTDIDEIFISHQNALICDIAARYTTDAAITEAPPFQLLLILWEGALPNGARQRRHGAWWAELGRKGGVEEVVKCTVAAVVMSWCDVQEI